MFQAVKNFLQPVDGKWRIDFFSGITVALALIPEAIAFSLVAHVNPLVGLYAAVIMCLTSAMLGGRPGMISGATGSMAVVIVSLVSTHGVNYLFATVILTGIFQILIGVFRLGKLIRILPKSVMVGFVNGLALVIFIAQLQQFRLHPSTGGAWLSGTPLLIMSGLVLVGMLITFFLPRFTKKLPSALIAIIAVTALVHLFGIHTHVVNDMMGSHKNITMPTFSLITVPLDWNTLKIIVPYAAILCIIGLSESLMTLSLIDEVTNTRGKANKECIAQGIGNIICGFFRGMGGCAMIGQSMININSGGRGRFSGLIAGCGLFLFIVIFWPYIKMIPLAGLVGVMFVVVIETFEWATFKFLRKIPLHDALVIVVVTVVTVFTNLAIAVLVGVVIAALVFAWQTAKNIYAEKSINKDGAQEYQIHGPLFFASVSHFKELFDYDCQAQEIIIDFKHSRVADHSAIDAIQYVTEKFTQANKNLHLRHLSPECKTLLGKAGNMVEANVLEDPDYHVAY
jgi:SulP family sulfate permease